MPFSELILWIYGREGPKVLIFGKLELWTRLAGVLVFLHLCATPLQQSRNTRNPNPKLLGRHHHLPNHRRYHHLTDTATTVADEPEFEERKTTDVCVLCVRTGIPTTTSFSPVALVHHHLHLHSFRPPLSTLHRHHLGVVWRRMLNYWFRCCFTLDCRLFPAQQKDGASRHMWAMGNGRELAPGSVFPATHDYRRTFPATEDYRREDLGSFSGEMNPDRKKSIGLGKDFSEWYHKL